MKFNTKWWEETFDKKALARVLALHQIDEKFDKDTKEIAKIFVPIIKRGGETYLSRDSSKEIITKENWPTLEKELIFLQKKYQLGSKSIPILFSIVIFGCVTHKWCDRFILQTPACFIYGAEKKEDGILAIPIYPDTTIKDIQKRWLKINKAKQEFYKVKEKDLQISKNYPRDMFILFLKKEGLTAKKIVRNVKDNYPSTTVGYNDISKIIKRLKNKT